MRTLMMTLITISIMWLQSLGLATAHPHVFIKPRAHFAFEQGVFSFFSVRWYFDNMSTLEFVGPRAMGLTTTLSDSEQQEILELEGFPRPKQLNRYFHVMVDDKLLTDLKPAAISLSVEEGRLVYAFTVGVYRPLTKVRIWFHDQSNFIAYDTRDGYFTTSERQQPDPDWHIVTNDNIDQLVIGR